MRTERNYYTKPSRCEVLINYSTGVVFASGRCESYWASSVSTFLNLNVRTVSVLSRPVANSNIQSIRWEIHWKRRMEGSIRQRKIDGKVASASTYKIIIPCANSQKARLTLTNNVSPGRGVQICCNYPTGAKRTRKICFAAWMSRFREIPTRLVDLW